MAEPVAFRFGRLIAARFIVVMDVPLPVHYAEKRERSVRSEELV